MPGMLPVITPSKPIANPPNPRPGGTPSSVTTATFPGPGTLTVFLLFAVIVGTSWEPVRPYAYVLLIIILVDLLFRAEPNITAWADSLSGFSSGGGGGGGGF